MIIEPLSKRTLEATIALVSAVFPEEDLRDAPPEKSFRASLDPELDRSSINEGLGVRKLAYWVALDDTRAQVMGVIGQYEQHGDPADLVWVGWFCVDPKFRGRGVGKALLSWNMQDATEKGYKTMRLYTSEDPNEQVAQRLYEQFGLQVESVKSVEGQKYRRLYRQAKLQSTEVSARSLDRDRGVVEIG